MERPKKKLKFFLGAYTLRQLWGTLQDFSFVESEY
jgi:hypothetical protein